MSTSTYLRNLKDQRRADLVIPYTPAPPKEETDVLSTLSTALPMAAMFTRQKSIGWASVILALQSWLNETPAAVEAGKQPAFFAVGMSLMSLFITYMPMFFPVPAKGAAPVATAA